MHLGFSLGLPDWENPDEGWVVSLRSWKRGRREPGFPAEQAAGYLWTWRPVSCDKDGDVPSQQTLTTHAQSHTHKGFLHNPGVSQQWEDRNWLTYDNTIKDNHKPHTQNQAGPITARLGKSGPLANKLSSLVAILELLLLQQLPVIKEMTTEIYPHECHIKTKQFK